MNESWILAVTPALCLVFLSLFARMYGRSWLEPSAFFALVWSLFVLLPLIFAPDYQVQAAAIWWIVASAFAVCCGSLTVTSSIRRQNRRDSSNRMCLPGLNVLIILSVLIGVLNSLFTIWTFGKNLRVLLSFNEYVQMTHAISFARYFEDYRPPLANQLLLIGVYFGPMLGGIRFATKNSKLDSYFAVISLVPSFLVFVTQTTRAAFLIAVVLWLSGYFSAEVFLKGSSAKLFSKRRIIVVISSIPVIIALFTIGNLFRGSHVPTLSTVWDVLSSPNTRASFFGHIAAFSDWFAQYWYAPQAPKLGAFSLVGLFELLGLHKRVLGVYAEEVEVEPGGFTNIYTVFRGLIQDFTLVGSLVLLFIVGIVAGWAYRRVSQRDLKYVPILMAFYSFSSYYIVSIFGYNSILFSWLLVTLYFWIPKKLVAGMEISHRNRIEDNAMIDKLQRLRLPWRMEGRGNSL